MSAQLNMRYPGIRPFRDNERMLFFGRDDDTQRLLHLVLSERLVVLFAKSGVGKSSLLNAGVLGPLEEQGYFPIRLRMNDPATDFMQSIDDQVEQVAKDKGIDHTPGNRETLWQYVKSSEFWSKDDTLLTPVLVFDQFEEIFTLDYSTEQRTAFFEQLADLVRGNMPAALKRQMEEGGVHYSESPPDVKIILSLREDFLAFLEEMATNIPSILTNRYRLTAMTPDQAREAIEEPAQLEHKNLSSRRFTYEKEAVNSIIRYLLKRDDSSRKTPTIGAKQWPWRILIYLSLWIFMVPLLVPPLLQYYEEEVILISYLTNVWFIIPLVTVILAFYWPIRVKYSLLPVCSLHVLCLAAFIVADLLHSTDLFYGILEVDSASISFLPAMVVNLGWVWVISWPYLKGRSYNLINEGKADGVILNATSATWPRTFSIGLACVIVLIMLVPPLFFEGTNREDFVLLGFTAILLVILPLSTIIATIVYEVSLRAVLGTLALLYGLFVIVCVSGAWLFLRVAPGDVFFGVAVIVACSLIIMLLNMAVIKLVHWRYRKGRDAKVTSLRVRAKDDIEPFQLQLLCQYIEDKILRKQKSEENGEALVITDRDFGGETGMHKILLEFYDNQIKRVKSNSRRRTRRLCERGLISASGRRLSLDEEIIVETFRISKPVLSKLIDFRLLRAEPRLHSFYYEISHDTLVKPILASAKRRRRLLLQTVGGLAFAGLFIFFATSLINQQVRILQDKAIEREGVLISAASRLVVSDTLTVRERAEFAKAVLDSINDIKNNNLFYDTKNRDQVDALDSYASVLSTRADMLPQISQLTVRQGDKELTKNDTMSVWFQPGEIELTIDYTPTQDTMKLYWYDHQGQVLSKNWIFPGGDSGGAYSKSVTYELYSLGSNEVRVYVQDQLVARQEFILSVGTENMSEKDPMWALYQGYSSWRDNDYKSAMNYFTDVIRESDRYSEQQQAFAHYWRGRVYEQFLEENPESDDLKVNAYESFTTALKLNPLYRSLLSSINTLNRDSLGQYYPNLVENSSFESPVLNDELTWLLTYSVDGWSTDSLVIDGSMQEANAFDVKSSKVGIQEGKFPEDAAEGSQFVELDGRYPSKIIQDIQTERGQKYLFAFAYSARIGVDNNKIEVRWDNKNLYDLDIDGRGRTNTLWYTYLFELTASSTSTRIEFIDRSLADGKGMGGYIDAVYVVKKNPELVD